MNLKIYISFVAFLSLIAVKSQVNELIINEDSYNQAVAFYSDATSNYNLKRYEQAKNQFDKAILLNPNNSDYFYGRGCSYYELGTYDLAIADLKMALSMEPDQSDYHYKLGNCYYRNKNYQDAINNYQSALRSSKVTEININEFNCKYNLGICALFIKDYNLVEKVFSELIEDDDEYGELYYNRGVAKMNLNRNEDACLDFKKALTLDVPKASRHVNTLCK